MSASSEISDAPIELDAQTTGPDLLQYMGTDAQKWAREFARQTATPNEKWDEDFLIGWFANALCAGEEAQRAREKGADPPVVRGDLWDFDMRCAVKSGMTSEAAERTADGLARHRAPKLSAEQRAKEYTSALAKELERQS